MTPYERLLARIEEAIGDKAMAVVDIASGGRDVRKLRDPILLGRGCARLADEEDGGRTMIGCEKLCEVCEACAPLVAALDMVKAWPEGVPTAAPAEWIGRVQHLGGALPVAPWTEAAKHPDAHALRAILDPEHLAEFLARALRGRGVDVEVMPDDGPFKARYTVTAFDHPWRTDYKGSVICVDEWNDARKNGLGRVAMRLDKVRAALTCLLALPLDCGAEKAIAALEG